MSSQNNLQTPVLIKCSIIHPSPDNKRSVTDEYIDELSKNIDEVGLMHYPIVRPHPSIDDEYELVIGEQRWKACSRLWKEMPVIIRELDDRTAHIMMYTENIKRFDLSPIEQSRGINLLVTDGFTFEEIADKLAKPVSWVARRAKLQDLSAAWRELLANQESDISRWPVSHLELVARFEHHIQDEFYREHIEENDGTYTLGELKGYLDSYLLKLTAAPWRIDDSDLCPEAGACTDCQKRTCAQQNLFEVLEIKGKNIDQCTDRVCWTKKIEAFITMKEASLRSENNQLIKINNAGYSGGFLPSDHELKTNSLKNWEYNECKKSDQGARQAIIVDGPGAGQTKWVKPQSDAAAAKAFAEPNTKSLKDRREALEKRRRVLVLKKLIEMIEAELKTPAKMKKLKQMDLLRAVLVFGSKNYSYVTDERINYFDQDGWGDYEEISDEFDTPSEIAIELCRCTLPFWKQELCICRDGSTNLDFAKKVCQFLQIDIDAIITSAAEEIKEPRAWANLKTDGTPKAAPAKNASVKKEKQTVSKGKTGSKSPKKAAKKTSYTAAEDDPASDDDMGDE
jgi:ParB/RepB/Spo0J family partition protein